MFPHKKLTVFVVLFTVLACSSASRRQSSQPSAPMLPDRDGELWAEKTLNALSLEDKVGQLFMVRLRVEFLRNGGAEYLRLRNEIHTYHIGAFAMSVPEQGRSETNRRYEIVALLNQLQLEAKLPLLVAGDFERGVLPTRIFGTTVFPHAMAFGAAGKLSYAEEFGRITAQESRALGVHWNLFPVADVNVNPANPIIGTRAFGGDPEQVGDLVAAYIRGARANGMLTTAKHFPGHGNTATDSHVGVPLVYENMARWLAVDLPPFRKAIAAGVDAVMTAHVRVPALDPDPTTVATTSKAIVTRVLQDQLGFRGIVVTDALDMAGLNRRYTRNPGRAAVDAFKAGNDVLTMPADLDASYRALLAAVRSGEIPVKRLDASVLKVLRAKASLGLEKNRLVDVAAIPRLVGCPQNLGEGQRISDDSITLVRDSGGLLPLHAWRPLRNGQRVGPAYHSLLMIILCDSIRANDGRVLETQFRKRVSDVAVVYVDPHSASAKSDDVLRAVDQAQTVVVAAYVVPSAARTRTVARGQKNSASLPDATGALLDRVLARAAAKTLVLAMGTPYLPEDFPSIQHYICTFSNATVSEISAAKALFGEIPIHGHLPVNIPNVSVSTAGTRRPTS